MLFCFLQCRCFRVTLLHPSDKILRLFPVGFVCLERKNLVFVCAVPFCLMATLSKRLHSFQFFVCLLMQAFSIDIALMFIILPPVFIFVINMRGKFKRNFTSFLYRSIMSLQKEKSYILDMYQKSDTNSPLRIPGVPRCFRKWKIPY